MSRNDKTSSDSHSIAMKHRHKRSSATHFSKARRQREMARWSRPLTARKVQGTMQGIHHMFRFGPQSCRSAATFKHKNAATAMWLTLSAQPSLQRPHQLISYLHRADYPSNHQRNSGSRGMVPQFERKEHDVDTHVFGAVFALLSGQSVAKQQLSFFICCFREVSDGFMQRRRAKGLQQVQHREAVRFTHRLLACLRLAHPPPRLRPHFPVSTLARVLLVRQHLRQR